MKLVEYRESHYYTYLSQLMPRPLGPLRGLQYSIKPCDKVVTWMKGERVMAIGGVATMWEGVGEAWILMDDQARRYPVMARKLCDQYLRQARQEFGRIQATVKSDFREGVRFAQSLGFSLNTENSPMKRYGLDGGDYHMLEMMGVE